ncbi:DUF4270 domain-containing protein, partial [Flavobacteriaceae bacterium]|nr:DUF4270 domain-containing protein [Flavobacteriaceae bacterium]
KDTLSSKDTDFTVALSTEVKDKVITSGISSVLLGAYNKVPFGKVSADIVGQITADDLSETNPLSFPDYDNTKAITVTLELPYSTSTNSDNELELTGKLGTGTDLTLQVDTFTTYLELLNSDLSDRNYYSDGTHDGDGDSKTNELGTLTTLATSNNYTIPTSVVAGDSIAISFDNTDYFKTLIDNVNNSATPIENSDDFKALFKGLKITASGTDDVLIPINLANATLTINYQTTASVEVESVFVFTDVRYNIYNHDHNSTAAADKLLIQGTAGYEVEADLASLVTNYSAASESENWLVNQAKIRFYVDETTVTDDTLGDLYIYDSEDTDDPVIDDYDTWGISIVDGTLHYIDVVNETEPYIEFFITEYVKSALANNSVNKLRIKSRFTSETTSIIDRSLNAKGVVLYNSTAAEAKRPELQVIYSKITN